MIRFFVLSPKLLPLALLLFAQTVSSSTLAQQPGSVDDVTRVLVRYQLGSPNLATQIEQAELEARLAQVRSELVRRNFDDSERISIIDRFESDLPLSGISIAYLTRAEIEQLQSDYAVRDIIPDGLDRPLADVSEIKADQLHSRGIRGAGGRVAILDTGVDQTHSHFSGIWAGGSCFSSSISGESESFCNEPGATPGDNCEEYSDNQTYGATGCGHGTIVASIAVGGRPLVFPGIGVAPESALYSVQVFSRIVDPEICGSPTPCVRSYVSDQIRALEYIYYNRASLNIDAINMSLGSEEHSGFCETDPRNTIIRALRDAGIATVAATGNDGGNFINAPACIPSVIAVGSRRDNSSRVSNFSNVSPAMDLLTVGEGISGAFPGANDGPGRVVENQEGTSFAAPFVTGTIALIRGNFPDTTVDEIESALKVGGQPGITMPFNPTAPHAPYLTTVYLNLNARASYEIIEQFAGANAGDLRVLDLGPFLFSGQHRVADSFTSRRYRLRNVSQSTLNYEAISRSPWLVIGSLDQTQSGRHISGQLPASGEVEIVVSVDSSAAIPGFQPGLFQVGPTGGPHIPVGVSVLSGVDRPANDHFAAAFQTSAFTPALHFLNEGATTEPGEPRHADITGAGSVWWTWRPRFDSSMRFWSTPNDANLALAVYTGENIGALAEIASNDNNSVDDLRSVVAFDAIAGDQYHIAVDSHAPIEASDFIVQSVSTALPPNSSQENATELEGDEGSMLAFVAENGPNESWFFWDAPSSGPVGFASSRQSTDFVVYRMEPGGSLTELAEIDADRDRSLLEFPVEAGDRLYIKATLNGGFAIFDIVWWRNHTNLDSLAAAVLPNRRSVFRGTTVTFFGSIVNPQSRADAAENCRIDPPIDFDGAFSFQATDPTTNLPVGEPNTPVMIPVGGAQSFVIAMSSAELNRRQRSYYPIFRCDGAEARQSLINRFSLVVDYHEPADIISILATPSGNGILDVPLGQVTAFAAAIVNIGTMETIQVGTDDGRIAYGLTAEVCETDPVSGRCIGDRSELVEIEIGRNEVRTFTVFVRSDGTEIPFSPANNRIDFVGDTSIAYRTTPAQ